MAHVVGVPRRDPCQKCQLPVFLAERLTVGKRVYHRTCLKCGRCGSQLTPGSFYETEVDDVYCCETCPDEEDVDNDEIATGSVVMRNVTPAPTTEEIGASSIAATAQARTVRSSIADRLAFFEQSKVGGGAEGSIAADTKLLQKSVSDEEKSKSLKRMEATTATPYKMNTAFSSFLNDTIDGGPEAESEPTSTADGKTETSDSEDDTGEDLSLDHAPPELPKTQPPAEVQIESVVTPNKRFTATAQMQLQIAAEPVEEIEAVASPLALVNSKDAEDNIRKSTTPEKKKTELQFTLTPAGETTTDNANNNDDSHKLEGETQSFAEESHKLTQKSLEINLELSQTNDNDCVTKDKIAETTAATTASSGSIEQIKIVQHEFETESQTEVETVVEQESPVELRTQPMKEVDVEEDKQPQHSIEDAAITERLSVVRARLQQFEVIATNSNANTPTTTTTATSPEKDNINANDKIILSDIDTKTPSTKPNTDYIKSELNEHTEPKNMHHEIVEDVMKLQAMEIDRESAERILESLNEVPLNDVETKDNENVASKPDTLKKVDEPIEEKKAQEESPEKSSKEDNMENIDTSTAQPEQTPKVELEQVIDEDYPEDLNPFQSDDEEDVAAEENKENQSQSRALTTTALTPKTDETGDSLNPFDSSDDEVELEKSAATTPSSRVPPPRPPPPRISRNPFGEDTDEDVNFSRRTSLSSSLSKKTPVPTPRTNVSQSQNPTPEPTPRLSQKTLQTQVLQNSSDYYGSSNSLSTTPQSLHRNSDMRGSNNSLTSSSAGGTIRSRKNRKAPAPPPTVKELFPSSETIDSSKASTPSSSTVGTPKSGRKKRHAPAPPKPARLDPSLLPQITLEHETNNAAPKNLLSYPLQSELNSKLSDEEKALLEGKQLMAASRRNSRRLIPLDASLLEDEYNDNYNDDDDDAGKCDDLKHKQQRRQHSEGLDEEESNVVYRRVLIPPHIDTPTHDSNPLLDDLNALARHDRQLEKLKDNKEANNRNRQSQISASSGAEDSDPATLYNKSSHGQWKRRKGPAPALPIPPRKVLQMLPLQEIRHELDIIEVQQQGLEKQGVILEKMIRDRCEDQNGQPIGGVVTNVDAGDGVDGKASSAVTEIAQNSKEVEDLILQLFELVNEKNELFRRQAELMYLRRQHRLEQEQADLEYEIRVLMAQPERNKTDTDKAREEALIARLVEVVQLRNEVVECLEMDRLREAEEDLSIKQRLELHTAQREGDADNDKKTLSKLSKKEKKKQKEAKKLSKSKKIDADKDADDTELNTDKQKIKKKKKKFLF